MLLYKFISCQINSLGIYCQFTEFWFSGKPFVSFENFDFGKSFVSFQNFDFQGKSCNYFRSFTLKVTYHCFLNYSPFISENTWQNSWKRWWSTYGDREKREHNLYFYHWANCFVSWVFRIRISETHSKVR